MTKTEQAIKALQTTIDQAQSRINFIKSIESAIEAIGVEPTGYEHFVDFDFLKHDQVMAVMLVFPGTWKKDYNATTITYSLTRPDDWVIRCFQGEPPPNCQIVEETVTVPEIVTPEHVSTIRKLVCK